MRIPRILLVVGCAGVLAACGSGGSETKDSADITKVVDVKSTFGKDFTVKDYGKTSIDPQMFANRQLPDGLKFDPPECSKFVINQQMPSDVQGNMAAVAAEGDSGRYITIAMETSKSLPFNDPGRGCERVGFIGGKVQGMVEVVEAPHIDGVRTIGVRRIRQVVIDGQPRAGGELYTYTAHFGNYQVIVTANQVVKKGQPSAPIDTERARNLLTAAVAAVRS